MSTRFTATLLRSSANGFAALAAGRLVERTDDGDGAKGGFEDWQAHFRTLLLELAAAHDGGTVEEFVSQVSWARDAFAARGVGTRKLGLGLQDLASVLEESLPADSWKAVSEYFVASARELEATSVPSGRQGPGSDPQAVLATAYIDALREGEGARAVELVMSAVREGRMSVSDVLEGVLTRSLREIGRLWHLGSINVADEHFATQTTGRLLEQIALIAPRAPSNGWTVLLTMVEGDVHELGLRIVATFFELDGWRTICLGANTPPTDLVETAQRLEADLVLLGATLNTQREAVGHSIELLKQARPGRAVIVGGPAFEGGAGALTGADGCALNPREALRMGRKMLESGS